jgi:WD40 repeat protein
MTRARSNHTATLLSDARVLIAGGSGDASAELYDPKSGTFSPTGSMTADRSYHTATRLSDGRVLIAGGIGNGVENSSAELYDPKTGTFSLTGPMAAARKFHTATLLSDGHVLIVGGCLAGGPNGCNETASAELYDPATGTFRPTGSMTNARLEGHTATLLSDGRVLIAGGSGTSSGRPSLALASAELYDPKSGTFRPTGSMTIGRDSHTATLLSDGRVLIAGGSDASGIVSWSAELYYPDAGTFRPAGPSMSTGRSNHTATLLSDGRVFIAGGSGDASAELYDPKTGTFSPTGSMTADRAWHAATLLSDGRVLIAGGDIGNAVVVASAELYQP